MNFLTDKDLSLMANHGYNILLSKLADERKRVEEAIFKLKKNNDTKAILIAKELYGTIQNDLIDLTYFGPSRRSERIFPENADINDIAFYSAKVERNIIQCIIAAYEDHTNEYHYPKFVESMQTNLDEIHARIRRLVVNVHSLYMFPMNI
jgi:hypothetical protein